MPADGCDVVVVAWEEIVVPLRRARREGRIVTPFLSEPVARQLVAETTLARARSFSLLTWLTDASTGSGFLDPRGLETLMEAGWQVRSLRHLHAKVVLVDSNFGLVGSGNFTAAGLHGGNVELGVVLSAAQRQAANELFERWWSAALPVTRRVLTPYLRTRKRVLAGDSGNDFGGTYRVPVPSRVAAQAHRSRQPWLKMMYATGARETARYWSSLNWISDRHTIGPDGTPKRKPSYRPGDIIVCYVTPWRRCPAIFEVLDSPRFDPDFVDARGNPGDAERWSWVTPVRSIAVAEPHAAPTLHDLGVATTSVRRQGHIRLKPDQYRRAAAGLPQTDRSRAARSL